jgi:hypothetical protein
MSVRAVASIPFRRLADKETGPCQSRAAHLCRRFPFISLDQRNDGVGQAVIAENNQPDVAQGEKAAKVIASIIIAGIVLMFASGLLHWIFFE